MSDVTELGYLRIGVSDLAAWRTFAADLIGLQAHDDTDTGALYLRCDSWHHRIVLEEDGRDDLVAVGLRVAGREEFRALQENLRTHQIPFEVADAKAAHSRRVLEMMYLKDPSGNPLEIFHGPQIDTHIPFHPGRGMFGKFVTGDGGLGHAMLVGHDLDATYEFYKHLGMRGGIEYKVPLPDRTLELLFMHCNSRDHTLAFGFPAKGKINHLMMEVSTLDDVYLTYELVKKAGIEIAILPGKHANDQMLSFYCISPSGFQVEIGWGARAATHQSEYYTGDTYGHEFTPAGMPS